MSMSCSLCGAGPPSSSSRLLIALQCHPHPGAAIVGEEQFCEYTRPVVEPSSACYHTLTLLNSISVSQ
jgi:hypothetical protein